MELRAKLGALLAATALSVAAPCAAPAGAAAASNSSPPSGSSPASTLTRPASETRPPASYSRSARSAQAIADRTEAVRDARHEHGGLSATAYLRRPDRWQVSYHAGGKERAQVLVSDRDGRVLEAWSGPQVAWTMARGYDGAFGRKLNAPYVWLPLCLVFLLPFFDPRRPFRLLHLDLLVLLGFGVSHFFFNRGEVFASVPLVYPVLLYLLVRMLVAGFRPRRRAPGRLLPLVPPAALALALVFLIGFRVGLNVVDSNVIDVGYAGVIGAERIAGGHSPYVGDFPADNAGGDTYGPVAYLAYVPFEQALPWRGVWDDLPAAHAAAITFDLLTMLALFVLGRRLRPGTPLGLALAFAWASYPYTFFALESNSNDSLVALLVVCALLALTTAFSTAPARGALLALGAAAKFAPLALAPLFAAGTGERRVRSAALFAAAFAGVSALVLLPFLPAGGLWELYDRTLGQQLGRESPFSLFGQHPSLQWLQTVAKVGALGLAMAVAFVPRRRSPGQVAALGAAVLIAIQLPATHWFYLYIVWFAPLVLVALFTEEPAASGRRGPSPGCEPREERPAEPGEQPSREPERPEAVPA